MSRSWWYKILFYTLCSLFALYWLLPSFLRLDTEKPSAERPFWQRLLPKDKIKLGLDLQGGIHLILGVDVDRIIENESRKYADDLQSLLKERGLSKVEITKVPYSSLLKAQLGSREDVQTLRKVLETRFNVLRPVEEEEAKNLVTLDLAEERKSELRQHTIGQAVETIRNRIDEYGVAEPDVRRQGNDRILVQLPGITNPERAKEMISRTAQLEFKLVHEGVPQAELEKWIQQVVAEKKWGEKYTARELNEALAGKIPPDTEVLFETKRDQTSGAQQRIPYLLESKVLLTGERLNDARVGYDSEQMGRPMVSLSMNQRGAEEFDQITAANIKRRLAIVLDNQVNSAPVIQTRIPNGRAQITLGSLMNAEQEARDLAAVLRAGALPAPVEILENRTVGPTLGDDSIAAGRRSIIIGSALVFAFMLFYYGLSGMIANLCVILNLLWVLAFLTLFQATLTLPGLAGMALTVGMAVDANVIIYERIREELRAKKSVREAIELGFERAHLTILDSNLTTVISALALLQYGTGPIKGFAITLIVGLIANYVTAVWVGRLIFDYLVEGRRVQTLSI